MLRTLYSVRSIPEGIKISWPIFTALLGIFCLLSKLFILSHIRKSGYRSPLAWVHTRYWDRQSREGVRWTW